MISISKLTGDATAGSVIIHELSSSDLKEKTSRVSRTKTLDGGVYINHSGFAHGDRTLSIKARLSSTQSAILTSIYESETFVLMSIPDGLYLGVIESMNDNNGDLSMSLMIKQKEN